MTSHSTSSMIPPHPPPPHTHTHKHDVHCTHTHRHLAPLDNTLQSDRKLPFFLLKKPFSPGKPPHDPLAQTVLAHQAPIASLTGLSLGMRLRRCLLFVISPFSLVIINLSSPPPTNEEGPQPSFKVCAIRFVSCAVNCYASLRNLMPLRLW